MHYIFIMYFNIIYFNKPDILIYILISQKIIEKLIFIHYNYIINIVVKHQESQISTYVVIAIIINHVSG